MIYISITVLSFFLYASSTRILPRNLIYDPRTPPNFPWVGCHRDQFNPVITQGSKSTGKGSVTDTSSEQTWISNDEKEDSAVNYLLTTAPDINRKFETLDAYYNGSLSITLTPTGPESGNNCSQLSLPAITNAFLRLGPQSQHGRSRAPYDNNTYYFAFGITLEEEYCEEAEDTFLGLLSFESSNDNLEHGQVWTLRSRKNGTAFDLSGHISTTYANYNNYFHHGRRNASSAGNHCPTTISMHTLLKSTEAKMTATVSSTIARMDFGFFNPEVGYNISGSFTGLWWQEGARLLPNTSTIQTTNPANPIQPRKTKSMPAWSIWGKYVFIVAVLVIAPTLILLLVYWFTKSKFYISRKRGSNRNNRRSKGQEPPDYDNPYQRILQSSPRLSSPITLTPPQAHFPTLTPHRARPRASSSPCKPLPLSDLVNASYVVSRVSFGDEIRKAQREVEKAQEDLRAARERGDERSVSFLEGLVKYHCGIIERCMKVGNEGRGGDGQDGAEEEGGFF